MIRIDSIRLEIKDEYIDISLEEANVLYHELKKFFDKDMQYTHVVQGGLHLLEPRGPSCGCQKDR